MQEVVLSNDIQVITAEINTYKQAVGKSVIEIGKRLNHVKKNNLAHGEFGDWLSSVDIHPRVAQQMMKVAKELELSNASTYSHFGLKALELLSSLPQEERGKLHEIPSTGETKTVYEMTVRELREVKSELKKAEARAEQAEQEAEDSRKARERAEEEADKPPEVITEYKTEYVDNTPDDYEKIRQENERYREKFGDINSFDGNTRRVSNRHDVMAMIQAFAHDSRQLLRKYSFLDDYAREIADMPDGVNEEFKSSLEAINRFVWKMAEHLDVGNDDVIDVESVNH